MTNKHAENTTTGQQMTPLRRSLPILSTLAIGIAVSFVLFAIVSKWEQKRLRIEFESRSKGYAYTLYHAIHDYIEGLHYVGDFFNNSEQVTRKEFTDYAMSAIVRHPGIQALGWDPLVLNSERAEYEARAREEGFENFVFTERTEENKLVRAAQRDEYVVVYYLEPLETNKPALGYDIASNPTRLKAINKAFDTGNMSATDRIHLVQEKGEQFGVLLLLPIYKQNVTLMTREDRRKNRKGLVVEVLRIGDVVEKIMENILDEGIDVYLHDLSADKANQFLYFRPSHTTGMTQQPLDIDEIQKGLYWSKKFDFADRQWQILFSPSSFYLKSQQSWQAWIVLSGSLLLTCLLAFYLWRKTVYTADIEQQFHKIDQILQTTMDGFILADTEGTLREVNSSYCDMTQYTQEELMKMNIRDLEVTLSPEEINRRIRKLVDQGKNRFETRHRCKDGRIIDLDVSAVIMKSLEAPFVATFVRDITDIKIYENTILEERNRAQKYLDIAGVMIATLDTKGTITLINQRGSEILGYREEDILGKNWFDCFLPARLKNEVYKVFLQLMAGDITPVEYYENPVLIQGGEERIVAFHNTVITDPPGEIIGVLFSGEDITERKKAEREQERLTSEIMIKNKELEQLLYVTSHDLRSPLVNISGYSRLLDQTLQELTSSIEHEKDPLIIKDKMTPIVKEDISDSLHYIQTSVLKMETLLKGILSLSRLGRIVLKIEKLDMNKMMGDIIDSHRFRLNELSIELEISTLPDCKGDRVQINQVFSNLLDNAIKYSDPERSSFIHISGHKDRDQSVYCMDDNGLGIAPEHQDKIFEIFHQLQPDRVKGEGMGLTIVYRILEKHKGKIWVESELGKGSRFFVSLPS